VSAAGSPHYFRLNLYHRILHGLVIVSFLGLAATGLPLKFAGTGWGAWLSWLLGGPFVARYLHRVFAVVTFLYFALHLGYVARLVLRGDRGVFWGPDSMVPQPRDAVQLVQHVRYFLGLGPRPRFGRWTYWEKFDYWAVFWGVAIIGSSGLLLWFPTAFARILPGWVFNVAVIVHSDEALLAVGFIFSVHFFNGSLRPEKFPMDPVIFTGRIEEEDFLREHPEEYERLRREGGLEARRADPPPRWLRNFARVAGLTALATGLVLLWLIIQTALHAL
jgi:cytochrome b subunit of formate dehydrogenase